ncbi:MAG: OFA family MFS transporter [Candidatus Syntrophosphaera sp.]|nr:OFA family MFS transporter [Candidatus Syntrophosphaera sp.]
MTDKNPIWRARWKVVWGGFLVAMVGGLSYSWGVFVEPMQSQFGWTKSDATLPLSVFMVVFAVMMIPGGKLQEKLGLRKQLRIGALLFLIAYLLSALVHFTVSKWWLVFSYGVVGGIACGVTYSCIAPPIRRWFPDHPGLAVSLGVMGFGLASFFFAPFKAKVALPLFGIFGTFILLAVITFAVLWYASRLVRFPDEDWFTHLFGTMHLTGQTSSILEDVHPRQMLKEKLFWFTWLSFLMVVFGSLMIIGILPSFGKEVLNLDPLQAAIPLSFFALTNGVSRPLAGILSDKIGALQLMVMVYVLQTAVFLILPFYINTLALLNLAGIVLGIGIGVTLALFPVLASEFFGVMHLGVNYGLLFSAYGFGALAIPTGAYLHGLTNSYTTPLLLAGVMSGIGTLLLACILLFIRKRPH